MANDFVYSPAQRPGLDATAATTAPVSAQFLVILQTTARYFGIEIPGAPAAPGSTSLGVL